MGSIALFLGVLTRWAALSLIPILLGAIVLVHLPMAFFFGNPHGGWRFPAFWAIAPVAQTRLGIGAFASTNEDLAAAAAAASVAARVLAVAAEPDPAALAALQLLRGQLQTLAGDELAALSVDTAVLLAKNASNGDDHERLLVEALLCAASSHQAAGRPEIARLRASRALAVAQVRLGPSDPATAACWQQLGQACEELRDITAAHAAYREADTASRDEQS